MSAQNVNNSAPNVAEAAVLLQSVEMPEDAVLIQGPDFNQKLSLSDIMGSYKSMGFQASGLGEAIDIVKQMVNIASFNEANFLFIFNKFLWFSPKKKKKKTKQKKN